MKVVWCIGPGCQPLKKGISLQVVANKIIINHQTRDNQPIKGFPIVPRVLQSNWINKGRIQKNWLYIIEHPFWYVKKVYRVLASGYWKLINNPFSILVISWRLHLQGMVIIKLKKGAKWLILIFNFWWGVVWQTVFSP